MIRLGSVASLVTAATDLGEMPFVALESVDAGTGRLSAVDLPTVRLLDAGVASAAVGDVLFGKLRPYLAKTWRVDRPVYASTELMCLRPRNGIDSGWLGYVATSRPLIDWAVASSDGAKMPRTSWERLRQYRLPVPRYDEQRAIAYYLDRETARIDALIAAKRRMRGLLGQRWQMVMQHAVAGRLDGGASARRPTTVPWLTDLPANWREGHLKLVATLGTGHTPSRSHPEWWADLTIPWITTGEVADMRSDNIEYVLETREKISEVGMANSSATLHAAGTVVLCRTASAGYSAIMGADMATSQDFATWTCGPLLRPRFLLLCLRAMRKDLLGRLAMGSTHKTIYMPDIESIKVPIPPVDDQDRVVEAAHAQHQPLQTGVARLDAQLELLTERRQALITAAVTGQIEVPVAA